MGKRQLFALLKRLNISGKNRSLLGKVPGDEDTSESSYVWTAFLFPVFVDSGNVLGTGFGVSAVFELLFHRPHTPLAPLTGEGTWRNKSEGTSSRLAPTWGLGFFLGFFEAS